MQPPPDIGRDLIPDNAYLTKMHFKRIREHETRASQPLPKNDKTYDIMRQRGQISGLSEALLGYTGLTPKKDNYKIGSTDIAPRMGYSGLKIPSIDYRAAMTMDAQRPTYVHQSNPAKYSCGLEDE